MLENARSIKDLLHPLQSHATETIDKHVEEMLRDGIIEPFTSPCGAGIVLVRKKNGSTRFWVDCRELNKLTIRDVYPLPRIDESLDNIFGNKWFSAQYLFSGYWQALTKPEDWLKTAFVTGKGLYQFKKMSFDLSYVPQRSNDLSKYSWQVFSGTYASFTWTM